MLRSIKKAKSILFYYKYTPIRRISMQVASDIHLEFYPNPKLKDFIRPSAPYLAIAGDLGIPYLKSYEKFLMECSINFQKTFIISGNHEYYQWKNKSDHKWSINRTNHEIDNICQKLGNVYYLNNRSHILNHNYIILGTTLWSQIKPISYQYSNSINDYNQIYYENFGNDILINPKYINDICNLNINWLVDQTAQFKDKQIIIMSHHLPSYQIIDQKYSNNPLNCYYASELEYLMTNNIHCWLAGHTHTNINTKINNCKVIVNPYGYAMRTSNHRENLQFKDNYVIDLN